MTQISQLLQHMTKSWERHHALRGISVLIGILFLAACGQGVGGTTSVPGSVATPSAVSTNIATIIPEVQPTILPSPTVAEDLTATTSPIQPSSTSEVDMTPQPTASVSTTATSVGNQDVMVTWSRSGGIAGLRNSMTIYTDGSVEYDTNGKQGTGQVDAATVATLLQSLNDPEWQKLQGIYGQQFPDAFMYRVRGAGKSVISYDGAEPPAILTKVLLQLSEIFQTVSSS